MRIAFVLLMAASAVEAQQAGTPARVGYLGAASYAANKSRVEAFRQGLREAGYIEGQNIVIDYRYADGIFARLPTLAAELVRLDVHVIVSGGSAATGPAKKVTATIPIVMTNDPDPVQTDSSPASLDLGATSPDWQLFLRRSAANAWRS